MDFSVQAGFDIQPDLLNMEYAYGPGVFGPETEQRHLDDVRASLSDPDTTGPDLVYAIAMDVGKRKDAGDLKSRNLLYGAMMLQAGIVGDEPVRSQGHVHAVSASCRRSTCEVYQIWSGKALIYLQESVDDNPARCLAVHARAGDVVVVPPAWAHCTINADPLHKLLFGAWCVRDYGFEYGGVRSHHGIAWFPKFRHGKIEFVPNPRYDTGQIELVDAWIPPDLGIRDDIPLYTQYEKNRSSFDCVTNPKAFDKVWEGYRL